MLIHFKGEYEEELYFDEEDQYLLRSLKPNGVTVREGPGSTVDRLLGYSLTRWAVGVSEWAIGTFRKEWAELGRSTELREQIFGDMQPEPWE